MPSEVKFQSISKERAFRDPVFTPAGMAGRRHGARPGSAPLALFPFGRALVDMLTGENDDVAADRLEGLHRMAGVACRCG